MGNQQRSFIKIFNKERSTTIPREGSTAQACGKWCRLSYIFKNI